MVIPGKATNLFKIISVALNEKPFTAFLSLLPLVWSCKLPNECHISINNALKSHGIIIENIKYVIKWEK